MALELKDVQDHLNAKAAEIKEAIADAQKQKSPITRKYATKVWQDAKNLAVAISTKFNITAHLHLLTDPSLLRDDRQESVLVNVAKFLENEAATFKLEHLKAGFELPKKKEGK